jgi:hypothetical protein
MPSQSCRVCFRCAGSHGFALQWHGTRDQSAQFSQPRRPRRILALPWRLGLLGVGFTQRPVLQPSTSSGKSGHLAKLSWTTPVFRPRSLKQDSGRLDIDDSMVDSAIGRLPTPTLTQSLNWIRVLRVLRVVHMEGVSVTPSGFPTGRKAQSMQAAAARVCYFQGSYQRRYVKQPGPKQTDSAPSQPLLLPRYAACAACIVISPPSLPHMPRPKMLCSLETLRNEPPSSASIRQRSLCLFRQRREAAALLSRSKTSDGTRHSPYNWPRTRSIPFSAPSVDHAARSQTLDVTDPAS